MNLAASLQTGPATSLSAGSKLLGTLILSLGLILVKDWVSCLALLLCQLAALRLLKVSLLPFLLRLWPLLLASLLSGWSSALLAEKTGQTLIELGPIWITSGSAAVGATLALRSLGLVLPGLFLLASTDPTDLADALGQTYRLPARFVLAALAAFRLLGLMASDWQALGYARRARGVDSGGNPIRRIGSLAGQALALLVQSIRRGNRLALTMQARGFGAGPRSWARVPHYGRADALFLAICLLLPLLAYTLAAQLGSLTFLWQ